LERDFLDRLVEFLRSSLLFLGVSEVVDGSTGLVHVSAEFVLDFEPLLLGTVGFQLSKTLAGLGEDGLLLGYVLGSTRLVERVCTGLSINRVRRVRCSGLVRSVGGSLGVTGSISDETENRESRRFTGGSVGGGRDQSGSGSGNSSKSIPTGGILLREGSSLFW